MDLELVGGKGEKGRPSEADIPPAKRPLPWLIICLVILSWVVFIYSLYKNNCPSKTSRCDKCLLYGALGRLSFQPLLENSQIGPAVSTLVDLGGLEWDFKKEKRKKWHILSSILFHRGLVDLILDTINLLYTGVELELSFGVVKIGSLYFLSSLGGSLWASLVFQGPVYVGGASGVCGLTGSAFAEFFINWNTREKKFKKFLSLCLGGVFSLSIKLFPWADASGNIGGLYFGFLLGLLLLVRCRPDTAGYKYKSSGFDPQLQPLNYSWHQRVLWIIALICTLIQFLGSLIKYILL